VNHQDCLATLLGAAGGWATGPAPAARERREAEEHVARCSNCWGVLSLLHELATGEAPPGAERMGTLFGCGPIRDEMYLLAGLTAEEIRTRHPDVARHLGWCHACRDRLAEVLTVEPAGSRGRLRLPLSVPAAPRWKEVTARAGQTVREAVGRAVIQLRRAGAVFTAVPEGFLVSPMPAPAGALRGSPPEETEASAVGQQVQFPLPDSDVSAELTLQPHSAERVGIALRFPGADQCGVSVQVREARAEGFELVTQYSLQSAGLLVVRGLTPGQYVLAIEDKARARRFQLRFDIESSA